MKYIIPSLLLVVVCTFFSGCIIHEYELNQDEDTAKLQEKYEHVINVAHSVACEDATEWEYAALGEQACGSPTEYVAYARTVDTVTLFYNINDYNSFLAVYNKKWDVTTDCTTAEEPTSVTCEDGEPTFVY